MAGPRNRFTIWSSLGPLIAHNCGAHTTRWSGGGRINPQNFPRVKRDKTGAVLLSTGHLRRALRAPPGKKVVACDSAQIEARMLSWFAGHTPLVEAFAQKRDVYSELASEIYRRHVDRKKNPEDEEAGNVGKTATLGLGYSMGPYKFADALLKGPMGAPPVQFRIEHARAMGVDVEAFARNDRKMKRVTEMVSRLPLQDLVVHVAVSDHVVRVYRENNPAIPKLWRDCEDKLLPWMLEGEEVQLGPIRTTYHGFILPNGLKIHYRGLHETEDGYAYIGGKGGKQLVRLYGGILTENIIQAIARCVIAEQMTALPYKVVTTSHDEIVLVTPAEEAEKALAHTLRVMKTAPAWAPGLPLSAEGGFADSYGLAKK